VLLDGVVIASLVRSGEKDYTIWTVELLENAPSSKRPPPFTQPEHSFASLEEARAWLGGAEIHDAGGHGTT